MTSGASATNSAAYLRKRSASPAPQRVVDPHVAADGPAQFLQPLQERRHASAVIPDRPRQSVMSTPMRRIRSALLRARRERPRRRAAEQRDELAPVSFDHLVGEREKSVGTSRPSAFAVLRLITNSNLVGRNTGKSAGFSPLRMRPA